MPTTLFPDETRRSAEERIRRGIPADAGELLDLETACFPPGIRESKRGILRSLESPHQEVWVSVRADRVCGAVFLRAYKRTMRIHSIAVAPWARGMGLGGHLLRSAENRAVERGASRMSLEVRISGEGLVEWYEHHGYRHAGNLPGYYGSCGDGLRMVKNLG